MLFRSAAEGTAVVSYTLGGQVEKWIIIVSAAPQAPAEKSEETGTPAGEAGASDEEVVTDEEEIITGEEETTASTEETEASTEETGASTEETEAAEETAETTEATEPTTGETEAAEETTAPTIQDSSMIEDVLGALGGAFGSNDLALGWDGASGYALTGEKTINVGETVTLDGTSSPKCNYSEWETDKKKVATVDDNGNVAGKSEGTATITHTYCTAEETEDCWHWYFGTLKTETITIKVTAVALEGLAIECADDSGDFSVTPHFC